MSSKFFYWLPRILTILSLAFMFMFSLDSFGGNESVARKMLGFFIQNIPVLILAIILIVAWKRELAGGILFILATLCAAVYFHSFTGNPGSIVVIAPFFLEGLLFIFHSVFFPANKTS